MSKNKIVVVESGIRASQLKDFWRMVEDGTIDGDVFGDFLGNPRKYKTDKLTLARAVNILSADKVYLPEKVCPLWSLPGLENIPAIRYSEAILRSCAKENAEGKVDWQLWYIPEGMSLFHQREIRGTDSAKPPYFHPNNNWWLGKENEGWTKKAPEAGYYLVDFKSRFAGMNWQKQEDEIAKFGSQYERADEAVFLFAIQSIYMLTGKNVTSDWWHWGKSVDSDGSRVSVCLWGWAYVRSGRHGYSDGDLRVCVSRKFDF